MVVEDWLGDSVVVIVSTSDLDSIDELLATPLMVDDDTG